ncbi:MAG: MATE family efflux transporter [Muribaculaceae bacterium]|nr:MATE family efflux transporter [Muribaculaceae bacterium]
MDKLNREILRLSLPTIVSNVTIPLLGICDTTISGHLGSELFLSAIAVGSVMMNVVFWIFGFLRGGTTGLTATALGAGNKSEISKVLYRALTIAFVAGILLIIFQDLIFKGLWYVAGGSEEIKVFVKDYFTIRIWGSPALLAVIAISGWFVGMQTTFYPMLIAILTNVINIIVSYSLAFPLGYGFNGVAIGTFISNWLGFAVAIGCMLWFLKGKLLKCTFTNLIKGNWWKYFSVNGNLFLRSLFIICVTMGVTAAGARIGNLTLAVNIIVMQYFQFFSFFIDGFAYSGEALVGLRFGERNFEMLKKSVTRLLQWTVGMAILFSFGYFIGLESITSLLTDSDNVITGVLELTLCVALIPLISCWSFIFDGFYVGITDTFKMMISTLLGGIIFFAVIGIDYLGMVLPFDGNKVIWTAFLSYLAIRGLYLALMWKPTINRAGRSFENITEKGI